MTEDAARSYIYAYFKAQWEAQYPTVPIVYDNQPFLDISARTSPLITVSVFFQMSEQMALGPAPPIRHWGTAEFTHFSKEGTGVKACMDASDFIRSKFTTLSVNGIVFKVPQVVSPAASSGWYRRIIMCPFYTDTLT